LQLSFATKIQLHVTHATTNLCSCLKQVAYDMYLHVTLQMQHVYTVLVYMFIHTYQSNVVAPYVQLFLQLHAINQNMTHV
jgi:hypothetical protein